VRRDGERLADIIEAAEKISVRAAKGRQAFDADEDIQIVLVHLIQVIGEAASGLSDELTSEHSLVPLGAAAPGLIGVEGRVALRVAGGLDGEWHGGRGTGDTGAHDAEIHDRTARLRYGSSRSASCPG
jgi:hypothetical protein